MVCRGVQHAHQKGIIHRDLKPTNVLVAEYDHKPVPKMIDFGVAKATSQELTEKTLFTQFGQIVGTLDYMSPEQAKFNQLDIDTRSDIYSLGVTLFELVTREPAFDGGDRSELLTEIASGKLRPPRDIAPDIPTALEAIILKATSLQADERYLTAGDFASDLLRFINGEKVRAKPRRKWLPGLGRKR